MAWRRSWMRTPASPAREGGGRQPRVRKVLRDMGVLPPWRMEGKRRSSRPSRTSEPFSSSPGELIYLRSIFGLRHACAGSASSQGKRKSPASRRLHAA